MFGFPERLLETTSEKFKMTRKANISPQDGPIMPPPSAQYRSYVASSLETIFFAYWSYSFMRKALCILEMLTFGKIMFNFIHQFVCLWGRMHETSFFTRPIFKCIIARHLLFSFMNRRMEQVTILESTEVNFCVHRISLSSHCTTFSRNTHSVVFRPDSGRSFMIGQNKLNPEAPPNLHLCCFVHRSKDTQSYWSMQLIFLPLVYSIGHTSPKKLSLSKGWCIEGLLPTSTNLGRII